MQVLLTNPEIDLLTYYLLAWTNDLIKESRSKTNKYYHLRRERVTRRRFESIRDAINSDVQSDADQFINWLLWDRDNLTLCQEG